MVTYVYGVWLSRIYLARFHHVKIVIRNYCLQVADHAKKEKENKIDEYQSVSHSLQESKFLYWFTFAIPKVQFSIK